MISIKIKSSFLFILIFLLNNYSYAACSYRSAQGGYYGPVYRQISFSKISVKSSDPAGTVLATKKTSSFCSDGIIYCNSSYYLGGNPLGNYQISADSNQKTFKTNIDGIGIRSWWQPVDYSRQTIWREHLTLNTSYGCAPMTVALVKLKDGPTGSGILNSGDVAGIYGTTNTGNEIYSNIVQISNSSIESSGCTVNNPKISVPLGNIELSHFTDINSTSSAKNYNIELQCGANTNIQFKIEPISQSATINANDGVISLDQSDNSAQGIGIQILFNSSPVKLNQNISAGSSSTSGIVSLNFAARYYAYAKQRNSGSGNAAITYSFFYD